MVIASRQYMTSSLRRATKIGTHPPEHARNGPCPDAHHKLVCGGKRTALRRIKFRLEFVLRRSECHVMIVKVSDDRQTHKIFTNNHAVSWEIRTQTLPQKVQASHTLQSCSQ